VQLCVWVRVKITGWIIIRTTRTHPRTRAALSRHDPRRGRQPIISVDRLASRSVRMHCEMTGGCSVRPAGGRETMVAGGRETMVCRRDPGPASHGLHHALMIRCCCRCGACCCADNAVNNTPTCLSPLMRDSRNKWGFRGYVTSDSDSVADAWRSHHFRNESEAQATADALNEGQCDIDSGQTYYEGIAPAVAQGLLSNASIDRALFNSMRIRFGALASSHYPVALSQSAVRRPIEQMACRALSIGPG
jgi:hypothetical protein